MKHSLAQSWTTSLH